MNYRRLRTARVRKLPSAACWPCSRSLVVAAGGLQAGICSEVDYPTAGYDMDQQAGPCNTITLRTYTNPAASVQVRCRAAARATAA